MKAPTNGPAPAEAHPFDEWASSRPLIDIHGRTLFRRLPEEIYPNGACRPGAERLFIRPDGRMSPCERVADTLIIGHVDDGYDFDAIEHLIDGYCGQSQADCTGCWAQRYCDGCFAHAFTDRLDISSKRRRFCEPARATIESRLQRYLETMEADPAAFERGVLRQTVELGLEKLERSLMRDLRRRLQAEGIVGTPEQDEASLRELEARWRPPAADLVERCRSTATAAVFDADEESHGAELDILLDQVTVSLAIARAFCTAAGFPSVDTDERVVRAWEAATLFGALACFLDQVLDEEGHAAQVAEAMGSLLTEDGDELLLRDIARIVRVVAEGDDTWGLHVCADLLEGLHARLEEMSVPPDEWARLVGLINEQLQCEIRHLTQRSDVPSEDLESLVRSRSVPFLWTMYAICMLGGRLDGELDASREALMGLGEALNLIDDVADLVEDVRRGRWSQLIIDLFRWQGRKLTGAWFDSTGPVQCRCMLERLLEEEIIQRTHARIAALCRDGEAVLPQDGAGTDFWVAFRSMANDILWDSTNG